ncbi:MAG: aminotransferase class V-fold PLP-dependent enzyme, partial [Bdellovibrionota bacterium]
APKCEMLVLDVYHSFMARPFSLKALQNDVYVLGGGYKYLQSGEGVCFLYTPPKADRLRPKNTGWYAHFESLGDRPSALCDYGHGAWRFWGASFDPSGLYRLRAVLNFFDRESLTAETIHRRSIDLQEHCLEILGMIPAKQEWLARLKEASEQVVAKADRGNFLSFPLQAGEARRVQDELSRRGVLCDSRESSTQSFLRFGFGLYHDIEDLAFLAERLSQP